MRFRALLLALALAGCRSGSAGNERNLIALPPNSGPPPSPPPFPFDEATARRYQKAYADWAGVAVEFDSNGQDRRLPMDLESGLFRMLDEALVAYLDRSPDQLILRLDWTPERVETRMTATRKVKPTEPAPELPTDGKDLPPALARMMEERRQAAVDAVEAARKRAIVAMPPTTWREIQGRAATIGVTAELLEEGSELHLVTDVPPDAEG